MRTLDGRKSKKGFRPQTLNREPEIFLGEDNSYNSLPNKSTFTK